MSLDGKVYAIGYPMNSEKTNKQGKISIYLSIFKVHPANDLNVFYIDVHTYYTLVLPVHSKYILQIFR